MNITSKVVGTVGQAKAKRAFPCVLRWAHDNDAPTSKDKYATGKETLIVLFLEEYKGVALANSGEPARVGKLEGWVSANQPNWVKFVGEISLVIS